MQRLVKSWALNKAESVENLLAEDNDNIPTMQSALLTPNAPTAGGYSINDLLPELRELFAYTLDVAVVTQLNDEPELAS